MKNSSILIIDDELDTLDVVEAFLRGQSYHLHYASSGQEAISVLDVVKPDLILLDVLMPDMDGIETCQRIKAIPAWEPVPIIVLTALSTKQSLAQCLSAGADDFMSKPINFLELNSRVRSMLRIHNQYQQLATFSAQLEQLVQQRTTQLQTMIFQDQMTQLPSKSFLIQRLSESLDSGQSSLALVYLDCDQFKLVNGSFGHDVGDQLLIAISDRIKQCISPNDVLARIGGDEFCYLLHEINDFVALEQFIQSVLQSFNQPFTVENCEIFMSVCIGVALVNGGDQQPEGLLQDADTAMYQAKLRGKGSYQIFDRKMHLTMLNRLTLENDLQRALKQDDFTVHYQPIINLKTQKLSGFEALIRWKHPRGDKVSPTEFIHSMETTGLIVPVGILVLRQACLQLQRWHQEGWTELTMSVNLSVRQFGSSTLLHDIDGVLAETAINPACLKLEITESAIMDNAELAIAITQELRSRQIQISIDDFGTGYSSLGYLHRFSVDNLKIDRSFVSQIQPDQVNFHVVNTIVALGKQLGISVIAEGIETPEQLECLQQLGCEFGQGYFFSEPLPADEIKIK